MTADLFDVTGGLTGLGEAVVRAGLFVPVLGLGGQAQRVGVLAAGLVGAACREERLTEAVAGLGLSRGVADLAVQGGGPPQQAGRRLAAPLPQLGQAQAGQRLCLAEPDAGLAAEPERLAQVPGGLRIAATAQVDEAEVVPYPGLPVPAAPAASATAAKATRPDPVATATAPLGTSWW